MAKSWWIKFERAQQHMLDIKKEVRRYNAEQPYTAAFVPQAQGEQHIFRYRLAMTKQPDDVLSAMIGDFVHNLRSALDHVVVAASSPREKRNSASWPVATEDLWERDSKRRYTIRDTERRKSFVRAVAGLDPQAREIIKAVQPFHLGAHAKDEIIAILSRLDNADKHRTLTITGTGLRRSVATVTARGQTQVVERRLGPGLMLKDGAEIAPLQWNWEPLSPSEVEMKLHGAVMVTIKVPVVGNNQPVEYALYKTMARAMNNVRAALRLIEPFTK